MTKWWNNNENVEKDEKDRKMKNDEEIKTWEISKFQSRYFKKIWQDEKMTKKWK